MTEIIDLHGDTGTKVRLSRLRLVYSIKDNFEYTESLIVMKPRKMIRTAHNSTPHGAGPRKRQKGFSLIEVLISMGVLGIIGLAVALGLITSSKVAYLTDERETAKNLPNHRWSM